MAEDSKGGGVSTAMLWWETICGKCTHVRETFRFVLVKMHGLVSVWKVSRKGKADKHIFKAGGVPISSSWL